MWPIASRSWIEFIFRCILLLQGLYMYVANVYIGLATGNSCGCSQKCLLLIDKYMVVKFALVCHLCVWEYLLSLPLLSKFIQYKSTTTSPQHTCHACHTYVHFQGMWVGLIVFICKLYMPCPCTVIHTHLYYCKLVAYADRRAAQNRSFKHKNPQFLYLLHHNLLTIYTNTPKSSSHL